MVEPSLNKARVLLPTAEELYHRLILLVGKPGSGKTVVLHKLADDLDTNVINVNLVLAEQLLELTTKQRALRLPALLELTSNGPEPVCLLDNTEILFDKDLQHDPLRLLQGISRNKTVVAAWNGLMNGTSLHYAEIDHPEYRSYDGHGLLIIEMENS